MKKLTIIALILLALDQITKFLLTGKKIILVNKIFELNYSTNYGIAFGLFKDLGFLAIIVSVIIIFLFIYFYKKEQDNLNKAGYALIISGALGNLIDRAIFGYVRDFISIISWPTFNLADSFITIGILIVVVNTIKSGKKP